MRALAGLCQPSLTLRGLASRRGTRKEITASRMSLGQLETGDSGCSPGKEGVRSRGYRGRGGRTVGPVSGESKLSFPGPLRDGKGQDRGPVPEW